jgi:hypothetical protein
MDAMNERCSTCGTEEIWYRLSVGNLAGNRPLGRLRRRQEVNIVTWFSVIIDGFWIDERIYWAVWYSRWLHFTVHPYAHTMVYSHVTSRCSVAAFNGGHSPSSGFPDYLRPQLPDSNNHSSQWLNLTSSLTDWLAQSLTNQLSSLTSLNSLTNELTPLHWPTEPLQK